MPSHSRVASAALVTLATLTAVAHANHEDDVWSAFGILNTFDPWNAEPFCKGLVKYEPPTETCWVTDTPVTVTTTTPCGYAASTPGYKATTPGYGTTKAGYGTTMPWSGITTPAPTPAPSSESWSDPGIATVLTTTTITYTTTSTIYVPAATGYPTSYKNRRDTFCPDYDVPCRLVQYDDATIAEACTKYLGQSAVTATITSHVHAPAVTVTAKECGTPGYEAKPKDDGYAAKPEDDGYDTKPADGYDTKPTPDYDTKPTDDYDSTEQWDDSYYGDPFPPSSGDGEDIPAGLYDDYAAGDGEDTPKGVYDNPGGDGVDGAWDYGNPVGDGEGLPEPFYIDGTGEEGQDDGLGYSSYDK
ncbi:hypothetical protein NX059_007707 [Plenodomus lindquistii]|nr:hypothetical protein NX059_007707 [Plenodomus lindquistii]